MIIVVFGASLLLCIGGYILYNETDCDDWALVLSGISAFFMCASLVAILFLSGSVSKLSVIDDRIAMYQEENAKIETQITEVVKQYQEYETDIFAEVNPNSAITLVSLYPELKSDSLVNSQIEVYVSNNQKIKELREEEIEGKVKRWWLYFGG